MVGLIVPVCQSMKAMGTYLIHEQTAMAICKKEAGGAQKESNFKSFVGYLSKQESRGTTHYHKIGTTIVLNVVVRVKENYTFLAFKFIKIFNKLLKVYMTYNLITNDFR